MKLNEALPAIFKRLVPVLEAGTLLDTARREMSLKKVASYRPRANGRSAK